jgi:[ribosomal protein S18]-alanine N-acetyltransferase
VSALPDLFPVFRPMGEADLSWVADIEPRIYAHPWTRGNFLDSLKAGYICRVVECGGERVGYGVLMIGVREAHLLNLSIAPERQRRGLGRALLDHFIGLARSQEALQMFLEVRPSNISARRLYAGSGFQQVAVRRGYYPDGNGREDAILMGLSL